MERVELAAAFVSLYEAIDGDTQEMSSRDLRLVNEHYPTYLQAQTLVGDRVVCPECKGTGLIEMLLGPERCNDCMGGTRRG